MIKKNQRLINILIFLIDIAILFLCFNLSFYLRFYSDLFQNDNGMLPYSTYLSVFFYVLPVFAFFQYIFGLYSIHRMKPILHEIGGIFQTQIVMALVMVSMLYVVKLVDISRQFIFIFAVINIFFFCTERVGLRLLLRYIRKLGFNRKHVMIVGYGELAKSYISAINRNNYLGYSVVGIVDDEAKNVKTLGKICDLDELLQKHKPDEVVIAIKLKNYDKIRDILECCEKSGTKSLIIPDYLKYISARPQMDQIDDVMLLSTRHIPLDEIANRALKRAFDIAFALFAIVVTAPIMIVTAALIKLTSPGKIMFKQQRIGYNKKVFTMYKFRTMGENVDQIDDGGWTTPNDPRRTKTGAFLRCTSIDELPQFFNVLMGKMSVIGPRPERPIFVEKFKEIVPKYMIKHQVRPGITGWAQVNGWRGDTSIEQRILHDIYYIENWSFLLDIKILILTFSKLFTNAY